jgi:hypothetical protein
MKRVLNTPLVGEMHIVHILYYQDPACYVYPRHWGMKMTKKKDPKGAPSKKEKMKHRKVRLHADFPSGCIRRRITEL